MQYVPNISMTLDSQKVWENSEKWPLVGPEGDFRAKIAQICTYLHGSGFAHLDHTAMSNFRNMISNDTLRRPAGCEVTCA